MKNFINESAFLQPDITKSDSEILKKYWNREISEAETYYTRQGKGAELLKDCFRKNSIEITREKKVIWE